MSGTSNSTVNVGPTAEYTNVNTQNLAYGDAAKKDAMKIQPKSSGHLLQSQQFPAAKLNILSPSVDSGWGPLGSYGNNLPAGSLYGYGVERGNGGVSSGYPQY